jgi:hypothetical protein
LLQNAFGIVLVLLMTLLSSKSFACENPVWIVNQSQWKNFPSKTVEFLEAKFSMDGCAGDFEKSKIEISLNDILLDKKIYLELYAQKTSNKQTGKNQIKLRFSDTKKQQQWNSFLAEHVFDAKSFQGLVLKMANRFFAEVIASNIQSADKVTNNSISHEKKLKLRHLVGDSYQVSLPKQQGYEYFQINTFDASGLNNGAKQIESISAFVPTFNPVVKDIYFPSGRLHQKDLDIYNEEYLDLFRVYSSDIKKEILESITEKIEEQIESREEGDSFQILELLALETNLHESFFGLGHVGGDRVDIIYPSVGGVYLMIKLRVRIDAGIRKTTNLTIKLKNLKVRDLIHFEYGSDGRIYVEVPKEARVEAKVDIDVSNTILNWIISAIEIVFDPFTKKLKREIAKKVRKKIEPEIAEIRKKAGEVHGKDMQYDLPKSDILENSQQIVNSIEDRMFLEKTNEFGEKYHYNLPGAFLTSVVLDEDLLLRFKDYPDFDLDEFPDYKKIHVGEDGAIWTGMLLKSLALKYSLQKDQKTLERLKIVLEKVRILATINGAGPLARAALPFDSPYLEDFSKNTGGIYSQKLIDGKLWYSFQGKDGVSRDQYMGIMNGLIHTYRLVEDESVSQFAKKTYLHLIQYLMDSQWKIFDDSTRELSWTSIVAPTSWAGSGYQKLNYLLAAAEMTKGDFEDELRNPYRKESQRLMPLLKMSWLNAFFSGVDAWSSYYSLNLNHTSLFTLQSQITDRNWLMHLDKMRRTLSYYTSNHKNPYFSLIQYITAKKLNREHELEKGLEEIKEEYNESLYRSHVAGLYPVEDYEIAKNTVIHEAYNDIGGEDLAISIAPLSPRFRYAEENFLWQRSPFYSIYNSNWQEKNTLDTGLSYHLLEWLIQYAERDIEQSSGVGN